MPLPEHPRPEPDLPGCEHERIHIPGSIQPHGLLFALSTPDLIIRHASANVESALGISAASCLGKPLASLFPTEAVETWKVALASSALENRPHYLGKLGREPEGSKQSYTAIGHRLDGLAILELEESPSGAGPSFDRLYPSLQDFMLRLEEIRGIEELSAYAAASVRQLTGFDRVLVYQFDADWHGTVIAEDRNEALPSYLDLRFPASDIPAQARELYRLSRIRLIADANYRPAPIVAESGQGGRPLDLSFAALRSVSPVHLEYMRNMGTMASMSFSILRRGRLWGLISCHHASPRFVPFEIRTACDSLAQIYSLQLAAHEQARGAELRVELKTAQASLLARMAEEEHFLDGLVKHPEELLGFLSASGAAVFHDGQIRLIGETPSEAQLQRLVVWLSSGELTGREVFATEMLPALFSEAQAYADKAAGVLAIAVSKLHRSYLMWFRPEVETTVKWGGDPGKSTKALPGERLHPRTSFDLWKETVALQSPPWRESEIEAATEFRAALIGIVLKRAEEMAQLNQELERSNKELEAFSYSVSHDLRAPFRHVIGYAELLQESEGSRLSETGQRYLRTIVESAVHAGKLVDNLLAFAQVGRSELTLTDIDMNELVRSVQKDVESEAAGRSIDWRLGSLPAVRVDPILWRQVIRNLLANAVKYTRKQPHAVIEMGCETRPGEQVFYVKDNGIGFDMQYAAKLFGVFQRLHRMEDFEGTGIGLANVRRIVERHGGRVWAEGAVNAGATFYFSLPQKDN